MYSSTLFLDTDGTRLAEEPGILPIPLYQGMKITIHGHSSAFEVIEWNYHPGHPDEGAGLRIILRKTP